MRFLVRQDHQQTQPSAGDVPPDGLDAVRTQGGELLSAGDDLIRRALGDGNSEAFLRAGRQQGGE